MGKNSTNLKIEMHKAINNQLRIGESKYNAKVEYRANCEAKGEKWNPAAADGIFSIATVEKYRQVTNEFCKWCKENYPQIKRIEQLEKSVAYEYLQERQQDGKSAYTISTEMAAINKITHLDLNKSEGALRERKAENITRSRKIAKMDQKVNEKNYSKQILIAKSFGCRRESIKGGKFEIKDKVNLYQNDRGEIFCRVIEKGGKYREAPCLKSMREEVLKNFEVLQGEKMSKQKFIEVYNGSGRDVMFRSYSRNIDNHAFRSEYATRLYAEREQEHPDSDRYKQYNRDAAQEVSKALGHNRLEIITAYVR